MQRSIDLNADMGEGFGAWKMGRDEELLKLVSSANVACGFHAGDPDVMAKTMRLAVENGVAIGAHPGFADLQGFGRRRISLSDAELRHLVTYQLGAAQAMARAEGGFVQHLKLHGALSNMAAEDEDLARICFEAALAIQPDLVMVVQAATAMQDAAMSLGCDWAAEIFADRAYADDGTLVPRGRPGAVIHDPDEATDRVIEMLEAGAIITESGRHIPSRIDTVCLHGDGENAVLLAQTLRDGLRDAGWAVAAFQAG